MQTRFTSQLLVQNRLPKAPKQCHNPHKEDLPPNTPHPCKLASKPVQPQDAFTRTRSNIVTIYSKMHYCFGLSF
jgi:hypothetical protein